MIEMLNNIADRWFIWQTAMLWQVMVLIAIVWVIDLLIKRWAWPQLRYALWFLILVKLVLPPTLTSPMSFTSEIPFAAQKAVKIQINHPEAPKVNKPVESVAITTPDLVPTDVTISSAEIVPSVEFSLKAYAFFAWLSGVVLLSAWLIIRLTCLRSEHLKSEQQINPSDRFKELLANAAKKLKLKRTPRVILTNKVCCPAVFGVFKAVILMPADKLKNLTSGDAEHILLHELAHIKRGDLLIHAIYMTLQVVYWFNPLLWLIRKHFQNLRELCCDATIARLLKEKTFNYRETLLETARQLLAEPVTAGLGLLGLFENSNRLVERLKWLEKKTWKNRALRTVTIVLLICVMISCVLPMAKADNQEEPAVDEIASGLNREPTVLAKELVQLLVDEQFSAATENFDATMKSLLHAGQLEKVWKDTVGPVGPFKQQISVRTEKYLSYDVVHISCEFEKGPFDVKVVYDDQRQVSGLFFVPTPQDVLEGYQEQQEEPIDEIVLGPEDEVYIASLNLTSPDVIRDVRTLFQGPERITSKQTEDIIGKLMTDRRPEAKRAAADLLACHYGWAKILVIRFLPAADDETEYFLTKIVEFWDNLEQKDKRQLQYSLPIVLESNKGNAAIKDLIDEIVALMISDSGKTVPLTGIELVKTMDLESDRIDVALGGQMENAIYDYFSNEHPVRKAVLELLGEEYVPPQREQVDYSQISAAKEMQLERSPGLTVGILASLYTATGPCISSGDVYGWYGQCYLFSVFGNRNINTYIYFHPITQVENSPFRDKSFYSCVGNIILNSASSYDLSMCDVIVLSDIRNIREEVIDALEDFVWNGGAIITLDGAGIVSCAAPKKFAALQDMRNLDWSWSRVADQRLVRTTETALTDDIDLSLPVDTPGRAFERNGYMFSNSKYNDQILLHFEPDKTVALRIGTYGSGRIAHFGWIPRFGSDEIGGRNEQLLHRVLLWAAGHEYKDLRPEPAYSKERYQEAEGVFGRIIDAFK